MRKELLSNLTNCGAITGANPHVLTTEKHLGNSEVCVVRFDPRKSNLKSVSGIVTYNPDQASGKTCHYVDVI